MKSSPLSQLFTTALFELIDYIKLLENYDKSKHGRWHLKKLVRKIKIRKQYVHDTFFAVTNYLNKRCSNKSKEHCEELISRLIKEGYLYNKPIHSFYYLIDMGCFPHIIKKRREKIIVRSKQKKILMEKAWETYVNKETIKEKRARLRKEEKKKIQEYYDSLLKI
jgi:hypothetical protein